MRTSCRVLVPVFFWSVMFPFFFVLHQPVDLCAIHDTIKLLNDDAALELFVCNIVALAAIVSCVCKTHIGCI